MRAHGLRGRVVVELWTNREERMAPGAVLHAGSRDLRVTGAAPAAPAGGRRRWVVDFDGISDREAAESLRGRVLFAEPISDPDALWVHELLGCEVLDSAGERVGTVEAVEANPASDLLVLDGGRLVPLRFVTERGPRWLRVEAPPGLLDP